MSLGNLSRWWRIRKELDATQPCVGSPGAPLNSCVVLTGVGFVAALIGVAGGVGWLAVAGLLSLAAGIVIAVATAIIGLFRSGN